MQPFAPTGDKIIDDNGTIVSLHVSLLKRGAKIIIKGDLNSLSAKLFISHNSITVIYIP